MSGLLGEIYSAGDRMKRRLTGLLADPIGSMQQTAGLLSDFRNEDADLNRQAFANPANPLQVTDQKAMGLLADRTLAGPLSFAPVGMISAQGKLGEYIPVKVKFDPGEKNYSFTQDSAGQAILNASPVWQYDKDFLRNRHFRAVDEFLWPFGENVYFRSHPKKQDYDFLASGTHKGSMNHATGEMEGGLSVARGLEHVSGYGYLVEGKKIGQGSDSEPLLELATARPVSPRMTLQEADDLYRAKRDEHARSLGITPEQLRALLTQTQLIFP